MMPRPQPSADRRRLAAALKALREDTGLSGERFGAPHGWSQGKVSKIENARTVPDPEDVETWVSAAGHPEQAGELVALAKSVAVQSRGYPGRRQGDTIAARGQEAGVLESMSTVVRIFQPAFVPGLLQTAAYARAVMELLDKPEEEIGPAVNVRMQRQDALYEPDRRFEIVLTEGALRWRPGSMEVMAGQYDRLLRVAEAESVDLRVIPFSIQARTFYDNPYIIFEIPDDPVVLIETTPIEDWVRGESDIEVCRTAFARAQESALAGDDALRMIDGLKRELGAG